MKFTKLISLSLIACSFSLSAMASDGGSATFSCSNKQIPYCSTSGVPLCPDTPASSQPGGVIGQIGTLTSTCPTGTVPGCTNTTGNTTVLSCVAKTTAPATTTTTTTAPATTTITKTAPATTAPPAPTCSEGQPSCTTQHYIGCTYRDGDSADVHPTCSNGATPHCIGLNPVCTKR